MKNIIKDIDKYVDFNPKNKIKDNIKLLKKLNKCKKDDYR